MIPPMMTCKDDTWSTDNRMVAVLTASAQLFMQSTVRAELLREIYPDSFKRLDDTNVPRFVGSLPAANLPAAGSRGADLGPRKGLVFKACSRILDPRPGKVDVLWKEPVHGEFRLKGESEVRIGWCAAVFEASSSRSCDMPRPRGLVPPGSQIGKVVPPGSTGSETMGCPEVAAGRLAAAEREVWGSR